MKIILKVCHPVITKRYDSAEQFREALEAYQHQDRRTRLPKRKPEEIQPVKKTALPVNGLVYVLTTFAMLPIVCFLFYWLHRSFGMFGYANMAILILPGIILYILGRKRNTQAAQIMHGIGLALITGSLISAASVFIIRSRVFPNYILYSVASLTGLIINLACINKDSKKAKAASTAGLILIVAANLMNFLTVMEEMANFH